MRALYPDLNDNTITLTLNDEDIEDAQNQTGEYKNIIEIPSDDWDHVVTNIDIPTQDYFNKIKINVEDIDEDDNPNTITIQIPQNPTLNQQNVLENIDVETSNLITYNENDLDFGTNINIDLTEYKKNIKTLETLTNKQLQSNQTTYTVSQLLTNQNSDGITKDSTLYVNVPVTPVPVIGFANIEENGQYLPNEFNSNGEYDPLNPNNNFDYLEQINVNVNNKLNIKYIKINSFVIADPDMNWNWTFYSNSSSRNPVSNNEQVLITKTSVGYDIRFYNETYSPSTISIPSNTWFYERDHSSSSSTKINLNDKNDITILSLYDEQYGGTVAGRITINSNIFTFDEIDWMVFN